MEPVVQISENLAFGPMPDADGLAMLAEQGFASLISLCHEGEEVCADSVAEERSAAMRAGLDWVSVPLPMRAITHETVDKFRRELARARKPVFVYDRTGSRAGAFVIIEFAVRRHMSGEQALARARELNVQLSDERMVDLIRRYVDSQRITQP